MMHRNISGSKMVFACVVFAALAYIVPAQNPTKGYCSTEADKPIVYFSRIFDVNIKPTSHTVNTQPVVNAFKIHLVEVYDYKSNAPYPIVCGLFKTLVEAEANKRNLEAEATSKGNHVVEVNWIPPAWGQVLESSDPNFMTRAPAYPVHSFCAVGHDDVMYFSDVFGNSSSQNYGTLSNAFNDFLRKRYGFEPQVDATCTPLNTVREAQEVLEARIGGVRYNKHKAVETGWIFDPTGKVTQPAARPISKVDDDPEPVKKPTVAAASSKDIEAFAINEVPVILARCQNDRIMSGAFDCYAIQRAVYTYRVGHAGDGAPEPLAVLVEKLKCEECIAQFAAAWARSAAVSRGLKPAAADCVADRFPTALHAKPFPTGASKIFNEAVTACNR